MPIELLPGDALETRGLANLTGGVPNRVPPVVMAPQPVFDGVRDGLVRPRIHHATLSQQVISALGGAEDGRLRLIAPPRSVIAVLSAHFGLYDTATLIPGPPPAARAATDADIRIRTGAPPEGQVGQGDGSAAVAIGPPISPNPAAPHVVAFVRNAAGLIAWEPGKAVYLSTDGDSPADILNPDPLSYIECVWGRTFGAGEDSTAIFSIAYTLAPAGCFAFA